MISAWKPSTNLRSEGERATSGANEATEPVRCLVLTRDQPERGRLRIAFRRPPPDERAHPRRGPRVRV